MQWMQDVYGDTRAFSGGLMDLFNDSQLQANDPQAYNRKALAAGQPSGAPSFSVTPGAGPQNFNLYNPFGGR